MDQRKARLRSGPALLPSRYFPPRESASSLAGGTRAGKKCPQTWRRNNFGKKVGTWAIPLSIKRLLPSKVHPCPAQRGDPTGGENKVRRETYSVERTRKPARLLDIFPVWVSARSRGTRVARFSNQIHDS